LGFISLSGREWESTTASAAAYTEAGVEWAVVVRVCLWTLELVR
jgi:hypothetical protein